MPNLKISGASVEAVERLLPERLSYLLEEKPLLWYESEDEYDSLLGELFAELDPKGVIEALLVKDIVDYFWEVRRMRSLKVAALHVEMPSAAAGLLQRSYNPMMRNFEAQQIKPMVYGAVSGLKLQADALLTQMREAHVTPQMMQYEALKTGLNVMSAIETSIVRLERRRDQLLKSLADRRQTFRAMAKGLIERDEAELIETAGGRAS